MKSKLRIIIPVVIVLGGITAALWFLVSTSRASANITTATGSIEAVTVNLGPELGGRVTAVNVREGDRVQAGDVLLTLDDSLLQVQRAGAAAALAASRANLALLQAGPSTEQLAVAAASVNQAQVAADAAQAAYDDLAESLQDTAQGKNLKTAADLAAAALASAQAQYDLLAAGARPGQIEAAAAQVDAAQAALDALDVQIARLTLTAPADGVILTRAVEPGEFAAPGSTLLVIGRLDDLTVTVYVPEDRYGRLALGQEYPLTVDSYPGETFTATVTHIADQAEFTPRNVQTVSSRKTTVFAIQLAVGDPAGKLKPGMPADVDFGGK